MAYGIRLLVKGERALFTRPEMKVERVSYDVITPSAARGIVEAIHWKPAIRWVIDRIQVLNEIRFDTIRRNEVASKIPGSSARSAMKKGTLEGLVNYVDEDRQQRAASILKDVAYVIEAHFVLTDKAEDGDSIGKHLDIFNRRARKGQCFQMPCFGVREFPADFTLLEDDERAHEPHESLIAQKDLGWMLHDIDFKNAMTPHFFRASIQNGWIDIPPLSFAERAA
ncbi:type I-C CRISPR-associated protein Cas5c [Caballeronia sp. SBC2]|uniref:type I-C CRISPR-associated protein Cas5c n=1 Tax=Caballeronia sp. SBC2 TaxID=2705547 RepID=UPI0013E10D1F|nr:type I-C CRISPR-associated protein Cas5c [Caballeronia sp. SBC2]QIE22101.1 CRISPR pre-crRNA endoribonuclease Cas5d [Caballeronia sp. SBC2]